HTPQSPWRRLPFLAGWPIALVVSFATAFAVAQEDDDDDEETTEATELEDAPVIPATDVEVVVVTGSRLAREPSELSRDVIVLDEDAIIASGELTLPRLLRQLPQNINATNETIGSGLNGTKNFTGASTVNLRGLGSESTLILIDGRRIGYSGLLGGVTDISTIPLSMVERVEIITDGASAIYGSDAVGGVVNVITKKDYSGVDVKLDYGRPHKPGYDESRASISAGWSWGDIRMRGGYEYFYDSGLDASKRETEVHRNRVDRNNQKGGLAGPQMRVFTYFFDDSCDDAKAVVYVLNGMVITRAEYAALDEDQKRRAVCHSDVTLPAGFRSGNDLNSIEIFGAPQWGEDAEFGYSLRPEQTHHAINIGGDYNLNESLALHGNLRYAQKDTTSDSGLNSISSWVHAGNPFNPFGHRVTMRGQILNAPPRQFASEKEDLGILLGVNGEFGDTGWSWQAEFSRSEETSDADRINILDTATIAVGLDSDGVTEVLLTNLSGVSEEECNAALSEYGGVRVVYTPPRGFFGSSCRVYGAPPDPIDPFGDLSGYVSPVLGTSATNEQMQFEAVARGELFDLGSGPVGVAVGVELRQDVIDTMSEFPNPGFGRCSEVGCPSSVVGADSFNTRISRDTQAAFFEGAIPLVREHTANVAVQHLTLTFSGRYDSYSNVEVDYRQTATGEAGTDNPQDPGAEFTWSVGLAYQPTDKVRVKADTRTAFVAPQLNQLIRRTQERQPAGAFRGLYFIKPDSMGRTQTHNNVFNNVGGNDKLIPETAESYSFSMEWMPLEGLSVLAGYSDTLFEDRIAYFSSLTGIDPDNLPSNVVYYPEEDIYIKDERYINVSSVERAGLDLELGYELPTDSGMFSLTVRRSYTSKFKVQVDAMSGEAQSLLKVRDDVTASRDALLSPVPAHSTYAQLTWSRGGLSFSVDAQGSGATSIVRLGSTDGYIYTTEPATIVDMVAVYDFEQGAWFNAPWTAGLRATLTVNNVTDAFARNSLTDRGELLARNPGHTEVNVINPAYEWTQGRAFRLSVSKSFSL
ncbi:MAG: TonB-dependent receptor, partial [Gammaproteobacteria bacterium]|nr:TonB-dependent receptor [Gammaproteobacteria bacterium]